MVSLTALVDELVSADVVIIGEQHTDAAGHAFQSAFVEALFARQPQAALALEMLERHEQSLVDLFIDDLIGVETFVKLTNSQHWAGKNTWKDWYQPMIDAAKSRRPDGAAVIAANATRRYVTMARLEGFEILSQLVAEEGHLFAIPNLAVDDSAYAQRFRDLMAPDDDLGHGEAIDPEVFLRAQRVWDATMAESVVAATQNHPLVILNVGDFHISRQGGTLVRIQHDLPQAVIRTISMKGKENTKLSDRADFIIHTK